MSHQKAINTAHDEQRPFCFRAEFFIIPYYVDRLVKEKEDDNLQS
jgi:hypothetical protein